MVAYSNGLMKMIISSSFIRICLLIAAFQIYITLCSLLFQKLEGQNFGNEKSDESLKTLIRHAFTLQGTQFQNLSIEEVKKAVKDDVRDSNRRHFYGIDNSYLFTLMSFTTLGNSGLKLTTWQARLFYVFTLPFGFALYIIIIISLAYHLRSIMQGCVTSLQNKHEDKIEYLNSKILIISITSSIMFLQIGGIVMTLKGDGYLYGLYLSMDSMAFVGNETIFKVGERIKLYFLLLFSFYLMLMHSILLVFIASCCHAWKEISDAIASSKKKFDCFEAQRLEPDYREKLLASFDSSSSGTPPKEHSVEDEAYFPQYKEINMLYDLGGESVGFDRRDSRFSEIFNAQKNNFEPINEGNESSEGNYSDDAASDEDISDFSSVKSNDEIADDESKLEKSVEEFQQKMNTHNEDEEMEFEQLKDELDNGKQRMSSPCNSTPSLPSSYSNISLDEWENEEDKEEDLSGRRLSSLGDLEMTFFDDSDATLTQQ